MRAGLVAGTLLRCLVMKTQRCLTMMTRQRQLRHPFIRGGGVIVKLKCEAPYARDAPRCATQRCRMSRPAFRPQPSRWSAIMMMLDLPVLWCSLRGVPSEHLT